MCTVMVKSCFKSTLVILSINVFNNSLPTIVHMVGFRIFCNQKKINIYCLTFDKVHVCWNFHQTSIIYFIWAPWMILSCYQNFLFKSKAEWEYTYDFQFWMMIIRGTISGLPMVGKRNSIFFQCPFLNQDWNWMTAVDLYSEIFHSELILDCVLTDSLVPWHSILEHILSNKEFITFRSGMVDGWDGGLVTKKSEVFAPLFHNWRSW